MEWKLKVTMSPLAGTCFLFFVDNPDLFSEHLGHWKNEVLPSLSSDNLLPEPNLPSLHKDRLRRDLAAKRYMVLFLFTTYCERAQTFAYFGWNYIAWHMRIPFTASNEKPPMALIAEVSDSVTSGSAVVGDAHMLAVGSNEEAHIGITESLISKFPVTFAPGAKSEAGEFTQFKVQPSAVDRLQCVLFLRPADLGKSKDYINIYFANQSDFDASDLDEQALHLLDERGAEFFATVRNALVVADSTARTTSVRPPRTIKDFKLGNGRDVCIDLKRVDCCVSISDDSKPRYATAWIAHRRPDSKAEEFTAGNRDGILTVVPSVSPKRAV